MRIKPGPVFVILFLEIFTVSIAATSAPRRIAAQGITPMPTPALPTSPLTVTPTPALNTQPFSAQGDSAQPTPVAAAGTSAASPEETPISAGLLKLDMDKIFPPGPGRELVFENCFTCHGFPPLLQQKTKGAWEMTVFKDHRGWHVVGRRDAEWYALLGYLQSHFNPETPLPELPPQFKRTWAAY